MSVVWQNSFDGPNFLTVTPENSADYGDPVSSVQGIVNYHTGWSAHGTSSAEMGLPGNENNSSLVVDLSSDGLTDWSVRWYCYVPEGSLQELRSGFWTFFTIDTRDPGDFYVNFLSTDISENASNMIGRTVRIEVSSRNGQDVGRIWWSAPNSSVDPDVEVQSASFLSNVATLDIWGIGQVTAFVDEVAVGDGEWIGPVGEFRTAEAHLGVQASIAASGENTSKGGRAHLGVGTSARVRPGLYADAEVSTGVGTGTDITWATSDEAHVRTGVRVQARATAESLIDDPPPIPPQLRFAVYNAAGSLRGYMYHMLSWEASMPLNDVGSLRFSVSHHSPDFRLIQQTAFEIGLEMRRSSDEEFTEPYSCRFIAMRVTEDHLDRAGVVEWSCVAYSWMLNKGRVITSIQEGGEKEFVDATPGRILSTLLLEAGDRDVFAQLFHTFGYSVDSSNNSWNDTGIDIKYSAGSSIMSIINAMVSGGSIDWRMNGRTLEVYNQNTTMYLDRTENKIKFDRDLVEARSESGRENSIGQLYAHVEDGHVGYISSESLPWEKWVEFFEILGCEDTKQDE